MPIYEYRCPRCGNFEVTQRISEDPLKKCPTCGAKVSKLISLSAFHLKGSGWYVTDYAKDGSSTPKSGDTKETKSGDAKETPSEKKDSSSSSPSTPTSSSSSSSTKASASTASS